MPRQSARLNKGLENGPARAAQVTPQPATRGRKRKPVEVAHTRSSKRLKRESVSPQPEDAVQGPTALDEPEEAEQPHGGDEAQDHDRIINGDTEPQVGGKGPREALEQSDPNEADRNANAPAFDQDLVDAAVRKAAEATAQLGMQPDSMDLRGEGDGINHLIPSIAHTRSAWDPCRSLKTHNLPILGQLSRQVISHLSDCRLDQIDQACQDPSSNHGHLWGYIRSLFDLAKKIYAEDAKFLDADTLDLREEHQRLDIRRANIATAVANIVCNDGPELLLKIHDVFLTTFVPHGSQLSQWQSEVLLQLKTQTYINLSISAEADRAKLTEQFFSSGLEIQLKHRHPDTGLSDIETHFLRDAWNRGEELSGLDFSTMTQKFRSEDFRACLYLRLKNILEDFFMEKPAAIQTSIEVPSVPLLPETSTMSIPLETDWMSSATDFTFDANGFDQSEMVRRAAMAAHAALRDGGMANLNQDISNTMVASGQASHTANAHTQNLSYPQQHSSYAPNHSSASNGAILEDSETSTRALYEKARQAATAKASSKSRGTTGNPSQRRPWNAEEENALMTGLDMVKGPHWSQILAMFGAGGTVSEVLKDRNQVQLKDKARNLKLFFLKSGNEVPNYLQHVTGELKTRAPNQVAKHEARDRLRESTTEDKATVDAINVLASGGRQSSSLDTGDEALSDTSASQNHIDGEDEEMLHEVVQNQREQNVERVFNQPGSDQMVRAALSEALHNTRNF